VSVRTVRQIPKHRYMYLLDLTSRLTVPVLPYPKADSSSYGYTPLTDSVST